MCRKGREGKSHHNELEAGAERVLCNTFMVLYATSSARCSQQRILRFYYQCPNPVFKPSDKPTLLVHHPLHNTLTQPTHTRAHPLSVAALAHTHVCMLHRDIEGAWQAPGFTLLIDHVQGDPYASPSRFRVQVRSSSSSSSSVVL